MNTTSSSAGRCAAAKITLVEERISSFSYSDVSNGDEMVSTMPNLLPSKAGGDFLSELYPFTKSGKVELTRDLSPSHCSSRVIEPHRPRKHDEVLTQGVVFPNS